MREATVLEDGKANFRLPSAFALPWKATLWPVLPPLPEGIIPRERSTPRVTSVFFAGRQVTEPARRREFLCLIRQMKNV
jgi:hypothetical protein